MDRVPGMTGPGDACSSVRGGDAVEQSPDHRGVAVAGELVLPLRRVERVAQLTPAFDGRPQALLPLLSERELLAQRVDRLPGGLLRVLDPELVRRHRSSSL